MQIVFKTTKESSSDPSATVGTSVIHAIGSGMPAPQVSKVFPGVSSGHRARLFTLELPDELTESEVEKVLARLRADESLEYAELPAVKRPMARAGG